jgi:hypothetical protein
MSGHLECFETVWGTVNEEYFDPAFGGEVTLDRTSLLQGRDSQLEAAIRAVQETVSER